MLLIVRNYIISLKITKNNTKINHHTGRLFNIIFVINPWSFITFQTDTNYNILAMTDLFTSITGIDFAESGGWGGDGNNIPDSIHSAYVELIGVQE